MKNFKIKPCGHLYSFLQTQMDGLTGNIEAAGYPFDRHVWDDPDFVPLKANYASWWAYEQTAYWIDGFTRTAILLGDEKAIKKASDIIYSVINNPDEDSFLGSKLLKNNGDTVYRWPYVVFFRACMALYDYNKDEKIPSAIAAHYLNGTYDYSDNRDVFNVEIMLWAYGITNGKRLLDLAESSYAEYNSKDQEKSVTGDSFRDSDFLTKRKIFIHGVSYNEYAKLGAILYKYTGKKKYLKVSVKAVDRLEKYYKLPGGCVSSAEYTTSNRYYEPYETCDISDYTWTLENMLGITENPVYADYIERCVFNAGVGSVTEDFHALMYFSSANQLITNEKANYSNFLMGNSMMSYSPHPKTQCCPGNVNRFMPNYVLSMWNVKDNDVYFNLLGPCSFEADINGGKIKIDVKTSYPFDNDFSIDIASDVEFTLHIRVPGFSQGYEKLPSGFEKEEGFIVSEIKGNTHFDLTLKDKIEMHNVYGGAYFTKGALVYSLGMKGKREFYLEETVNGKDFPSYRMSPDKPWNYAFEENASPVFEKGNSTTFDLDSDISCIKVKARKVENWKIREIKKCKCWTWDYKDTVKEGPFVFTPKIPNMKNAKVSDTEETITLYPYGASKVRMTVLPVVKNK